MRIECFNHTAGEADINLYYCGYEDCRDNFCAGPSIKDDYLVHFVLKGAGYFKTEKNLYEISEGDYFVIFPGQIVRYWSEQKPAWSFCWIAFNGKNAMKHLKNSDISVVNPVGHLKAEDCKDIRSEIDKMTGLIENPGPGSQTRLLSHLYSVVSIMESANPNTDPVFNDHQFANEYVEKALMFLKYNYNKRITVKDIVAYVQLDRSYFSKVFKRYVGSSPQEYILKFRIEKSLKLIRSTNLKLNEICKCVGIEEEYYFWRLFKKYTGLSPTQYIKSLR